jgi:Domain of unknown function (DUF4173)
LSRLKATEAQSLVCGSLLFLNVANPEAVVVGLNVNRASATHKIDAQYLRELSSDSALALFASQLRIDPALWQDVKAVACAGPRTYAPNPFAFNWADAEAARARREVC